MCIKAAYHFSESDFLSEGETEFVDGSEIFRKVTKIVKNLPEIKLFKALLPSRYLEKFIFKKLGIEAWTKRYQIVIFIYLRKNFPKRRKFAQSGNTGRRLNRSEIASKALPTDGPETS
jgi:hypothetical protein